jgi:protein NUD1
MSSLDLHGWLRTCPEAPDAAQADVASKGTRRGDTQAQTTSLAFTITCRSPCLLAQRACRLVILLAAVAFSSSTTTMSVSSLSRPAWQTEDLQDEWVDLEEGESTISHHTNNDSLTRSISLTAPLATYIHTNSDAGTDDEADVSQHSAAPVGTFVVHDDQPPPHLPKTPGKGKKSNMKNIFTPLPLERMFDPPTPPHSEIRPPSVREPTPLHQESPRQEAEVPEQEDEILETDIPDMHSFHGRKASLSCQFTFTAPRQDYLNPDPSPSYPQAESTPAPPTAFNAAYPLSSGEPPLRLFQFQYDTYTREHLSAMVDSIAINTPSGSAFSPTAMNHGLSKVSEQTGSRESSLIDLRSAKRLKLSPPGDLMGDEEKTTDEKMPDAVITRPRLYGKDYVGASRSLMQQIKEARDFSTISTVASGQQRTPGGNSMSTPARSEISSAKLGMVLLVRLTFPS